MECHIYIQIKFCNPYLNPNNVIVDENLHPKLTEIGCLTNPENTRNFSPTTTSTLKFNDSFYYLSPEKLLSNDNVTGKSDVYSFGLIAYAIATNKIAFQEEEDPSQFIQKVIEDICRLKLKGDVPNGFLDMIERCLSIKPDDRPSFIEILNELEGGNQFLTDDVDKEEYGKYIQYIKENKK